MINPENEILKALINYIIPAALAGAVAQIATRMLNKDITFTGAFLIIIIAGAVSIPVGLVVYTNSTSPTSTIAVTVAVALLSRELSQWFVYGMKIDKAMNALFEVLWKRVLKMFK